MSVISDTFTAITVPPRKNKGNVAAPSGGSRLSAALQALFHIGHQTAAFQDFQHKRRERAAPILLSRRHIMDLTGDAVDFQQVSLRDFRRASDVITGSPILMAFL